MASSLAQPSQIYSVASITRRVQELLQNGIGSVWIEGEISNLSISGAGHAYFTLKDEQAQLRGVMWRSAVEAIPFDLTDGLEVLAFGSIDVYAARGQYQLTVRQVVPKGLGPLELAFRQLRDRLEKEGLFRPERKRPIPAFPRRVALVTSPASAAVRDFLEVAGRRWPGLDVIVLPSAVQGEGAAAELCRALALAQLLPDVDVIALVRGGGSLEDLWSFNDETLARVIAASSVPVVSGVGHEIDVTIADLVADLRALTPSEAAERIFPDATALSLTLDRQRDRLARALAGSVERARRQVESLQQRSWLARPTARKDEASRRVDDAESRIMSGVRRRLDQEKQRVQLAAKSLDALSPLAVLARGFSLTSNAADGRPISLARNVNIGDRVSIRFADGTVEGEVQMVEIHDGGRDGEL